VGGSRRVGPATPPLRLQRRSRGRPFSSFLSSSANVARAKDWQQVVCPGNFQPS